MILLESFSLTFVSASDLEPFLVKDINKNVTYENITINETELKSCNNKLFYWANDSIHGFEPWTSDGSEVGTFMLKDINEGENNSPDYGQFICWENIAYFTTDNPTYGWELWRSDGTEVGTYLVKDIYPGSGDGDVNYLHIAGDYLFFYAHDDSHGYELWRSDGSEEGTIMTKDIYPGSSSGNPFNLFPFGDILVFSATDGVNGYELWKTDGTEAGTTLVKDINVGSAHSEPSPLLAESDILYFTANNGVNGAELWKSDGTEAGTVMVKDINPGGGSSWPNEMVSNDGDLFFRANDGIHGYELWKSDGSEIGTSLVKDIYPGGDFGYPYFLTVLNDQLIFKAVDGINGNELWKSDGSEAGTTMVKDIEPAGDSYPQKFKIVGNTMFFQAYTDTNGSELWKTDGSEVGTVLVKDIFPDGEGSEIENLTAFNDILIFSAVDSANNGYELWKSDGSESGTNMIKDIALGSESGFASQNIIVNNQAVYFIGNDRSNGPELWRSGGSQESTLMVYDHPNRNESSEVYGLTVFKDKLFFNATDGEVGIELWNTDGTELGTSLVKNIRYSPPILFSLPNYYPTSAYYQERLQFQPMVLDSSPSGHSVVGDILFFSANDGTNGRELWKSDGTEDGTVLVKNIRTDGLPAPSSTSWSLQADLGSEVSDLTEVGTTLFFKASNGIDGYELWKSNGSEEGTIMVKDIYPGGSSSDPTSLIALGDKLFFSARDANHGFEPWISDGSEEGTSILKDICAEDIEPSALDLEGVGFLPQDTYGSDPSDPLLSNGVIYFAADDCSHGYELWRSDGTQAGTYMVKDINSGDGSYPEPIAQKDGIVYFKADDGINGAELWRSDGTEAGTYMLKDIRPGSSGSNIDQGYVFKGILYFSADDGVHYSELWRSDGSEAGTYMLKDISQYSFLGNYIYGFEATKNHLYFVAYDDPLWGTSGLGGPPYGGELWRTDGTETGTIPVSDINPGGYSSFIEEITNFNGMIYFAAYNNLIGRELWALQLDEQSPNLTFVGFPSSKIYERKPIFYGHVEDLYSNIASVEYLLQPSDGIWRSCLASDGSFDEKQEDFSCGVVNTLANGVYSITIRSADSEGNQTPLGSELQGSFEVASRASYSPPVGIGGEDPEGIGITNHSVTEGELPGTVIITWETDMPTRGYVKYGPFDEGDGIFSYSTMLEDELSMGPRSITLTGLETGQTYKYEIVVTTEQGSSFSVMGTFQIGESSDEDFISYHGGWYEEGRGVLINYSILRPADCIVRYGLMPDQYIYEGVDESGQGLSKIILFDQVNASKLYFEIRCEEEETSKEHVFDSYVEVLIKYPETGEQESEEVDFLESVSSSIRGILSTSSASTLSMTALIIPIITFTLPQISLILFSFQYGFVFLSSFKKKQWGTIYDALSLKPVAYAVIRIYSNNGEQVGLSVSGLDGKYRVELNKGEYRYEVAHENYEPVIEMIRVAFDDGLIKDVGLKPLNAKGISRPFITLAGIFKLLTLLAFLYSFLCVLFNPILINIFIFTTYILLFILRSITQNRNNQGKIKDEKGKALDGVFIKVWSRDQGRQLETSISRGGGLVNFNVPDGEYNIIPFKNGYKLKGNNEQWLNMHIEGGRLSEGIELIAV